MPWCLERITFERHHVHRFFFHLKSYFCPLSRFLLYCFVSIFKTRVIVSSCIFFFKCVLLSGVAMSTATKIKNKL